MGAISRLMKKATKLFAILFLIGLVVGMLAAARPRVKLVKDVAFEKSSEERWIGLVADTHIPLRAEKIPPKLFKIFERVDLIIHAGDFVSIDVLRELEKIAPVIAVQGNMDLDEVREELPKINSAEIAGRRIGVVHDAGIFGTEKMKAIAGENDFDVLIFGHTHRQFFLENEGRIFINPGSPTNPLPPFLVKPSIAILKISERAVEVVFIEI